MEKEINTVSVSEYISGWPTHAIEPGDGLIEPWAYIKDITAIIRQAILRLDPMTYSITGDQAVHKSATIQRGATCKGALIIGPDCFVASGALIRGGAWLKNKCIIGPGAELKSSIIFDNTAIAHFNFVGDSIVGADVNFEAGSIACNFRNEKPSEYISVFVDGAKISTNVGKFGALIGDGCKIGANAVLAPGTILKKGAIIQRASLCDQSLTYKEKND